MLYYATFSKFNTLIIPHWEETNNKIIKKYNSALKFYEMLNFEKLAQHFTLKVMVEGAYYGILLDFGADGVTVMDIPFKYARSNFKTPNGVDIVELDLSYFDTIRDKSKRDSCLNTYPKEVKKAYNAFKNRNGARWYMLEPGVGIHFNLVEERPFMLNVIPAIIDFDDFRDIEKRKSLQELKKLLIQKMPITNDGELVFEPEEVEEIHRGVVGMLKRNSDVDVLTSFGEVKLEDLQDAQSVVTNNLEKIEKIIYSEAGVSKQVFAADGNLSLEKSVINDEALISFLSTSYKIWLSYIINLRFGDSKISFSAEILPVNFYNEEKYIDRNLKMAQYGYSFLVPAVAMGFNQSQITDLKKLEIDVLGLDKKLIPLKSSHTQTDNVDNEGGREEKDQAEKDDRTLENEQSLDGGGN